ncbi:hypothetical protein Cfor_02138 [Coptotermes formosanus]|uniref:Uncharacterized protein n=1 Tax=Coptotermes formosanus TaxID=36987 RepID=A0A6L2PCR1_COPFO|nr:hypothetical protein Cfor_02138 [Coptotermes formosanus]
MAWHHPASPQKKFKEGWAVPSAGKVTATVFWDAEGMLLSPDPGPSYFHLFEALKGAIRGIKFGSCDKVSEEVAASENSNWYKKGIVALAPRWHKAVEVSGDCAEK